MSQLHKQSYEPQNGPKKLYITDSLITAAADIPCYLIPFLQLVYIPFLLIKRTGIKHQPVACIKVLCFLIELQDNLTKLERLGYMCNKSK